MKRFISLILISVVAFSLFVIPAGAVTYPSHFYIPFTTLSVEDEHGWLTYSFNLNEVGDRDPAKVGSLVRQEYSEQDREMEFDITNIVNNAAQSSVSFVVSDHMQNLSNVTYELYAEDFIISRSVLSNNTYYIVPQDQDATLRHDISITFSLSRLELVDGQYVNRSYSGFTTASFVNGFDIMDAIEKRLPSAVTADEYLRFNYVSVYVDSVRSGAGLPGFMFTLRGTGTANNPPSISDWVRQFDMRQLIYNVPDIEDVDFTSWLSTSLRSVLDFELWPGMTMDVLIRFVVTAGLLLWFITMLI